MTIALDQAIKMRHHYYVRNEQGHPMGCVVIIPHDSTGETVCRGVSILHGSDVWNKARAVGIATSRAMKALKSQTNNEPYNRLGDIGGSVSDFLYNLGALVGPKVHDSALSEFKSIYSDESLPYEKRILVKPERVSADSCAVILSHLNAHATAAYYFSSNTMVVSSGSRCNNVISATALKAAQTILSLIDEGVLVKQNNQYVFTTSYKFDSPSAAASVILGQNASGTKSWRVPPDMITLDEYKKKFRTA